jgi:hypothetical protein
MADDTNKTGLDRRFIALGQDYEVRDWTQTLDCTEEQLREAVRAVGNSASAVRQYLGKEIAPA